MDGGYYEYIYKNGDNGLTNLIDTKNVSKSDGRIELIGVLEELISHIGLIKAQEPHPDTRKFLDDIRQDLLSIIKWIAKPYEKDNKLQVESIHVLEDEIIRLEEMHSVHDKKAFREATESLHRQMLQEQ